MPDSVRMRAKPLTPTSCRCRHCSWYWPHLTPFTSGATVVETRPLKELVEEAKKHARANRGHVVTIDRASPITIERVR